MLTNVNPRDDRLYGMMQALMAGAAQNDPAPAPEEPRGIVTEPDAADAVLALSAVIDAHVQSGAVSQQAGAHMAAMLMTIRDHIRPLPIGLVDRDDGNGEHDGVSEDLQGVVDGLRTAGADLGIRG